MRIVGRVVMMLPFVLLLFSGCVKRIGPERLPEPSPNFRPQNEYAVSFESVWKAVNDVLESNRIAVAIANREEGRISTDYVKGPGQIIVLGGMKDTRYKYAIRVSRGATASTRISILANLEAWGRTPTGETVDWHDVGSENKAIVANLENWLHEQIQMAIMKP